MKSPAKYYHQDIQKFISDKKERRYNVLNHTLNKAIDVQNLVKQVGKVSDEETRIVNISFNYSWRPILNLATVLKLRKKEDIEPNWLTKNDIKNIFYLEGMEEIKNGSRFLIPFDLGFISDFANRYLANLPFLNTLCLTNYQIFRKAPKRKEFSVSIIIPARNEEGNIKNILKKIPKIGKKQEVIFIEGGSKDKTYKAIENEILKNKPKWMKVSLYKQKGVGKKNAVVMGFSKAKYELLMILDADLTVKPKELRKFYDAVASGKADLAIGSRLVYPMEKQAMRFLNYLGNKLFSAIFSYLIGQEIKDTLCGTKVILRKNYDLIKKNQKYLGDFDPFGDFDLIFGAANLDLKITEIPIRYGDRTYGTTNISRFTHGLLLAKMAIVAARKIKFR